MFWQRNNNKGNIGIAIVVALIAIISGASLASIALRDSVSFRMQLDAVQEFHLLRSEVGRGRLLAGYLETVPTPPLQTTLPNRSVQIDFGNHRTTYKTRTKLNLIETGYDTDYLIRSLITARRGEGTLLMPEQESPVKRYGENRIMSLQTIALFHYFSDIDKHIDESIRIVFAGEDIIRGRVHSNTDINVNYSIHSSWPTFYGLVSTSGVVNPDGPSYPQEEIFKGGLIEEYPRIAFEPSAERVRALGGRPLGSRERDDAIAYVTVDGSSYEMWLGEVEVEQGVEWVEGYNQFTIYDSYPPYGPVGREIGVNRIPRKDTVWRPAEGGSVVNTSAFIPMELWISGSFSGRQTWASSHDIYLKDDLTYVNTPPGQRPDGFDDEGNPTGNANLSDYLGIISEESIFIQYGHRDPRDSTKSIRLRPNLDDIYMYGAYAAVGQGDHPWEDGLIRIQYLHPKGSTPPQYSHGEFFQKIDLHLFHYPTTTLNRWPPGVCYPWYNPLWPEPGRLIRVDELPGWSWTPNPHDAPEVVRDRGDIWLFGSFAQRRRGAVGASAGGDIRYEWDIYNEISPNTPPTFGYWERGRTGYGKRYHTDFRFERTGPPHFPLVLFEGYETEELRDLGYQTLNWVFRTPPSNF